MEFPDNLSMEPLQLKLPIYMAGSDQTDVHIRYDPNYLKKLAFISTGDVLYLALSDSVDELHFTNSDVQDKAEDALLDYCYQLAHTIRSAAEAELSAAC